MSKIYLITSKSDQSVIRYVRANTLNGAIRALTDELYEVEAMGAEERTVLNVVAHIQNMIDELMREHLELMHPTPKPPKKRKGASRA